MPATSRRSTSSVAADELIPGRGLRRLCHPVEGIAKAGDHLRAKRFRAAASPRSSRCVRAGRAESRSPHPGGEQSDGVRPAIGRPAPDEQAHPGPTRRRRSGRSRSMTGRLWSPTSSLRPTRASASSSADRPAIAVGSRQARGARGRTDRLVASVADRWSRSAGDRRLGPPRWLSIVSIGRASVKRSHGPGTHRFVVVPEQPAERSSSVPPITNREHKARILRRWFGVLIERLRAGPPLPRRAARRGVDRSVRTRRALRTNHSFGCRCNATSSRSLSVTTSDGRHGLRRGETGKSGPRNGGRRRVRGTRRYRSSRATNTLPSGP